LENGLRRWRKNGFRTFVHPEVQMRESIGRAGFALISCQRTVVWSADVYLRRTVPPTQTPSGRRVM